MGVDAGTHGLPTPFVQELACPNGRAVLPELLKGLLEKVSPDGARVIPDQVAEAESLLGLQILFPFE